MKLKEQFIRCILRKICKLIVNNNHKVWIEEYYSIMFVEAQRRFTEDNHPTIVGNLRKHFDNSVDTRNHILLEYPHDY